MKTTIIKIISKIKLFTCLFPVTIVYTNCAVAQTTEVDKSIVPITVEYNAITGKLSIPKPAKIPLFFPAKRSIYANFKITNINPFYNNINIKAEQKNITIDMPTKFLSLLGDDKKRISLLLKL